MRGGVDGRHTVAFMTTMTAELDSALALVADRAAAAEQMRRLDDDVIAALSHAGVNRTLLPAGLGGREAHPGELVDVVARVAAADGSTGWCTAIGAVSNLFSGYVSETAAREMYANPDVGIAAMFAPTGVVTRTRAEDGGFDAILTGRWPFTSNCLHAGWIGVGALIRGEEGTERVPSTCICVRSSSGGAVLSRATTGRAGRRMPR